MMLKCKRETAFADGILAHPVAGAMTPNAGNCGSNASEVKHD